MIRGIWGDENRYIESYFSQAKKEGKPVYFSGDGAFYDDNGYITITGRTDDVVNVAGHRIGTAEIESAIAKHPSVAESAVVSVLDAIKGESLFAFVVLNPTSSCDLGGAIETLKELNDILRAEIGPIAKIEKILYTTGLPKTRSGKIMRRILRTIARGEELKQDISTLEDSGVVQSIIDAAKTGIQ